MEEKGEPDCPPPWGPSFGRSDSDLCLCVSCYLFVSLFLRLSQSLCLCHSVSLSPCPGFPVPGGAGWVRDLEERETFSGRFSVHLPPPPAKFRSKGNTRGGRDGGRAGRGRVPGACRGQSRPWVRLFAPTKEETARGRGSAWSRSPGEKVGEGTRTRTLATPGSHSIPSLGEKLRSRELLRDQEMVRDAETIETEIESEVEKNRDSERPLSGPESQRKELQRQRERER